MENKMIDRAEELFYKTYSRLPVVSDHREGAKLYDTEGTEHLDFGAGIVVMAPGYHGAEYTGAVQEQVEKLFHTPNLFYNRPSVDAAGKLLTVSSMDRVFFTNGDTETIEEALKIAKRYVYNRDGHDDREIIIMGHSFHGRSIDALSVTGNDHCQKPFRPLLPGVKFAVLNDLDSMKVLVNESTCAIIMGTIQGEGGICSATEGSLRGVRVLRDEHDILLILDEIRYGVGRSGSMFAWQEYGMKPDVMIMAKAPRNGAPIGAFLASGKVTTAIQPSDHGTTYGGSPLVCVAASKVLDAFEERGIVEHVQEVGAYLWEKLEEFVDKHDCAVTHHGKGLVQGLELNYPATPIVKEVLLE